MPRCGAVQPARRLRLGYHRTLLPRAKVLEPRFFFFQAEDGIRAFHVTGVQTCALPILQRDGYALSVVGEPRDLGRRRRGGGGVVRRPLDRGARRARPPFARRGAALVLGDRDLRRRHLLKRPAQSRKLPRSPAPSQLTFARESRGCESSSSDTARRLCPSVTCAPIVRRVISIQSTPAVTPASGPFRRTPCASPVVSHIERRAA